MTACIAARERALRVFPDTPLEKLVIYGTTQTHSLGAKAALILGLQFRAIETRAEDLWALRGKDLEAALDDDAAKGNVPFILCRFAGLVRRKKKAGNSFRFLSLLQWLRWDPLLLVLLTT